MSKPRYPAHLFHKLLSYPEKRCEVCDAPMLPHVRPPNKWNTREWLEPLNAFQRRRTCGHACGNVLTRRAKEAKKAAQEPGAPDPGRAPTEEAAKAFAAAVAPPPPRRLERQPAPHFPTPAGLHASQLDIGHAYAQPSASERPLPIRRQRPKPSRRAPLPDQVADLITRTKGRDFQAAEIAKAYDLTEPEAERLLSELADAHQIRRRLDPFGHYHYASLRP